MCDANANTNASTKANNVHTSNSKTRKVRYASAGEVKMVNEADIYYLRFAFAFTLPRFMCVKC